MSAWRALPTGLSLRVRATPRSSSNGVRGLVDFPDAEGGAALSVTTMAAPADGAANKAITVILAKALGVPKNAVRVVSGHTGRIKRVEVVGDDQALMERVEQICGIRNSSLS